MDGYAYLEIYVFPPHLPSDIRKESSTMYDAAVIGAGVVGAFIARTLTACRVRVVMLEAQNDVAKGQSSANSAIVHAGFDAKEGSLKALLNVRGSEMMENVCRELGVKYRRNGSIVIGFNDEDKKTLEALYERGVTNGVREMSLLTGDEARAVEPGLSPAVTCALFAPTGAIVCPYELTMAAVGNAMDNGADLKLNFKVDSITDRGDHYEISDGTQTMEARYVVNAAGVYSDAVAAMVGDTSFDVHPRRGEYVLLDKTAGRLVDRTVFRTPSKMGKGILVSPTVDGNLLTGPTSVDMVDKTDRSTTQEGLDKVMKEAAENVPAIRFNCSITSFTGLRAVGSTGDFIINSPAPRFVNAAGIESPGLSSAPAIGLYVRDLLGTLGLDVTPRDDFDPIRPALHGFRDLPAGQKNEIIKKDPAYGHVICRCETVTEGEILAAIRTNPKPSDLDGVKRRTRAQMGRCQGGFCSPVILDLLARELGVSPSEITKCGGQSNVLFGKTKED